MAHVELLGIRHHGPGSARSLIAALDACGPDLILVEGPPEASGLMGLVADPDLRPPVAILAYDPAEPERSAFYPFATFSPEWQAMRFAAERGTPVRFADLPLRHALAVREEVDLTEMAELVAAAQAADAEPAPADIAAEPDDGSEAATFDEDLLLSDVALRLDPIGTLGRAIGEDGERWWDRFVEHRHDPTEIFEAVGLLMAELREGVEPTRFDALREAAMRDAIRAAEAEGADHIAVVCGAYHVPALVDRTDCRWRCRPPCGPPVEHHRDHLGAVERAAPRHGVGLWRGRRLARLVSAPVGGRPPARRDMAGRAWHDFSATTGFDISPAHLIEAARLAETTAALRGRSTPGLDEVNEAIRAVLTFGSSVPLGLISERLIIGTELGAVPASVATAPLARDLAAAQRRLRLTPAVTTAAIDLDLRRDIDIGRSHLFHRLLVLDVPWAVPAEETRRVMGTFREAWTLRWDPMFAVALVTQSRWGNTIPDAATARLLDTAAEGGPSRRTGRLPRALALRRPARGDGRADLPDRGIGRRRRRCGRAAVCVAGTGAVAAVWLGPRA